MCLKYSESIKHNFTICCAAYFEWIRTPLALKILRYRCVTESWPFSFLFAFNFISSIRTSLISVLFRDFCVQLFFVNSLTGLKRSFHRRSLLFLVYTSNCFIKPKVAFVFAWLYLLRLTSAEELTKVKSAFTECPDICRFSTNHPDCNVFNFVKN